MHKRFEIGDLVMHDEYGVGRIIDVDEGNCYPYKVHFKSTTIWCARWALELTAHEEIKKWWQIWKKK